MAPGPQPLSEDQMRRTWVLVNILTSLKSRANQPPPTAAWICRKFDALSLPALDTLSILVDHTIAETHGQLSRSHVGGMARAVRAFRKDTASEVAYAHACNNVVSDATVKAARIQTSHALRIGLEHLGVAYKRGIPLCPIATDLHLEALEALGKGNKSKALEIIRVDDAHVPEDGGFVSSSSGLLTGAACCIEVMGRLDLPSDICCGSCHQIVSADELTICRRCGDQLLCKGCLAGEGYARHLTNECRRVRAKVRGIAQSLVPHLRESALRVAVVRLNRPGLFVPMHITSLASPLIPSSLLESLLRWNAVVPHCAVVLYWRLLVSFLADMEGDEQEAIFYDTQRNTRASRTSVHHVPAAEYAIEDDTQPSKRGAPKLLPSERRRLRKGMKAAEKCVKEEARAAAEAAAVAEANAVLERQSARPDATSSMLTSVLLKRGGAASPEIVTRTRVKRDSLKAIERDARKPAKAKPEDPKIRISRDLTNGRLDAALLLQRRARTWLRGRKKLRRKLRSRTVKRIQSSVRTWLRLRVRAKPCIAITATLSGSEGADGEEAELPEAELPKPDSTDPFTTECAVCLDDDANYAVVPCGHRCLCADCLKMVSHCPVCRTRMAAVLRVFV